MMKKLEEYSQHKIYYDDRDVNPLPQLIADGMKALKCYESTAISDIITEAYNERIQGKAQREQEFEAKLAEAIRTGERVLFEQYAVEDTGDEGDVDTISVYINPDGTQTEIQSHNY